MNIADRGFSPKRKRSAIIAAMFVAASGTASGSWWLVYNSSHGTYDAAPALSRNAGAPLPHPELQLYKPLLPEQAKMENDKLAFSEAPIEMAMPLVLPRSELLPIGRRTATNCLTSAIYYEAGNEIAQGKRAVAQVILNRVRHPAYPKTICGVVYQGSERRTGCQFTFTCDGSLARRPAEDRWEQARLIATSAISGAVEPSVGMATHYHANYVLPYWASSLDKISQIGLHIFYRWKGKWGQRKSFSQGVQLEVETLPIDTVTEYLPALVDNVSSPQNLQKLPSQIMADDASSASVLVAPATQINRPETSAILADQKRSTLVIDEKKTDLKNK